MKRLLLAMFLVPSLGLAAHHEKAHQGQDAAAPSDDPMAGWVPPKVKNEAKDKQEIQALFRAMEAAGRTGDLDTAVALVDFPVMMITDDSKGEAMGEAWSREQWIEVMKPFYDKPMKDMKITHKPSIFLLSDSLASVDDVVTMTMGGKTITSRNSMFVIRKEGKWRVKAMAEGGWGDMMAQAPHGAGSATPGAPSGSEGSTMGTTGSATGTTGSQTTETQAPTGAQPTTK
jgi:hypothetical protein